jgi:hypothetical protein
MLPVQRSSADDGAARIQPIMRVALRLHKKNDLPKTRRFGRAHAFLRRAGERLPPTPRGLLLAALCGAAFYFWGVGQSDLVVFVFGAMGLTLVAASVLLVELVAWRCRRALAAGPRSDVQRLEAGSPIATGFVLPAQHRWPLVQVRWDWRHPRRVSCRQRFRESRLHEEVVARRRGDVAAIERRIIVESTFGLARVAWRHMEQRPLLILPEVGALRSLPVIRSLASGDALSHPAGAPEGDRMEIRRYAPGDPVRHILWKVFARTRQLNIRTPERAVDRSRRTLAYFLAGGEDEATAAVARVALTQNLLGERWLFGADGSEETTEQLEPALRMIARSASDLAMPALDGLRRFVRRPEVADEAHGVLFAPAHPGPWLDDLFASMPQLRLRLTLVFGTDGVRRGETPPLWRNLLFRPIPEPETASADELQQILRRCAAARCPALVIDRRTGRVHGAPHAPTVLPAGLRAAS